MPILTDILTLIAITMALYVGVLRFLLKSSFHSLRQMPADSLQRQLSNSFEPLIYKQLHGLTKKDFVILLMAGTLGAFSKVISLATHLF
jgi:hypothetical protein